MDLKMGSSTQEERRKFSQSGQRALQDKYGVAIHVLGGVRGGTVTYLRYGPEHFADLVSARHWACIEKSRANCARMTELARLARLKRKQEEEECP